MKYITLKARLENINTMFDDAEKALKEKRQQAISDAWEEAVASGSLKQDLEV